MKPNFALTLSFDGIGLLQRDASGWLVVGDVQLDSADLAGALQRLAAKARALDPSGLRSKVVIPNGQIRFLDFESDSRDVDILEAQVRIALDGATPYHISELAYDWSMSEGRVCVAAVAIETLTEAETFAVDHGFGPLSFVAIPERGQFEGEPFFGETVHAGEVLTPGEVVERDETRIEISGMAALPEPKAKPKPAPQPEPEPEAAAPVQEAPPKIEPEAKPEPEPTPAPAPDPTPGFSSRRGRKDDQPAADPAPAPKAPKAEPEPEASPAPKPVAAFSSARNAPPAGEAPAKSPAADLPESRFTPAADPGAAPAKPKADAKPKPPTAPKPAQPKAKPPKPSPAPPPAPKPAQPVADAPIRPVEKPSAPASKHPGRVPFLSRRKSDGKGADAASVSAAKDGEKRWNIDLRAGLDKAKAAAAGLSLPKPNLAGKPAQTPAQQSAARAREDEKQRMTVFGARNPDNAGPEDKPRFVALMVTAGLLLFLVGIAAWAALFLDDGISGLFKSSDDVQFAQEEPAVEAPVEAPETATAEDLADELQELGAETEALADRPFDEQPNLPSEISEELSPDEARARYAATGIWQMAPQPSQAPFALDREDVYQTSLDPAVNFSDAVALPDAESLLGAGRPPTPANPPPPGIDYARDDRGFIAATPEGTITPEGITLFAGAPPLKPTVYPERAEPEPVEVETTEEPVTAGANIRPRARPDDLNESFERSNNGGRTLAELQDIRPRLRPKSAQDQALEAAGISPVIDEGAEDQLEDALEQAVATSPKPRTRPEGFAARVEETRTAAASEPVSVEQRVAVNIPTTASVARAATESARITLRRVNLIGVYGSSEDRRALVRMPNGRYKKVRVGDRLDGGKVAAIGDGELRYIKGGQSVVLKMPQS